MIPAECGQFTFDEAAHRYSLGGAPVPNVTRVLEAGCRPRLRVSHSHPSIPHGSIRPTQA